MILITSYQRKTQLLSLLKSLQGNIIVVDDGSTYDPTRHLQYCEYYRFSHKGKVGFWMQWQYMMELAQESDDDWFLFTQDDVSDIQLDKIKQICESIEGDYAFNFMRRGSKRGWTNIKWEDVTIGGVQCQVCDYVDCNFACSRGALERIGFDMKPVDPRRFERKNISSGVGQQLSQRFAWRGVPMYVPQTSLAYHGDHPSLMHPQERQRNPLISR